MVKAFMTRSPLDYAAAIMSDLVGEGLYDEMEAARTRSLAAAFSGAVVSTSGTHADSHVGTASPAPDPFDLLIAIVSARPMRRPRL